MQTPPLFLSNLSTPCAQGMLGFPTSSTIRHHLHEDEQRERNSPQFTACSDENIMPILSNICCRDTSSPFVSISRESRRSRQQKNPIGISTSSLDDMLSFATPLSPAPPHCGFDVFTSVCGGTYEHVPALQQSFTEMNTSIGALRNTSYNNSMITSHNNISNVNGLSIGWGNNIKQGEESEEASCLLANSSIPLFPKKEECVCLSQCVESENLVSVSGLNICNDSLSKNLTKPLESTAFRVSHVMTTVAHTTLGGHRNSQEDAVCIHENIPFPVECSLLQQKQQQQQYYYGSSDSYNVYGVFDGHNGDRLSNLASLYYLEHFNEALTRSSLQLLATHEVEEKISQSAGVSISNKGDCMSCNTNMNTGIKVNEKSIGEMPNTEETIPPQRFVSSALVQSLIHLDRTLYDTVHNTQRHCIGTTAGIVAFYQGASAMPNGSIPSYISIANLGDSRAVLARISDGSVLVSTVDHRISTHPLERTRVAECGGCIECDRVDGALQVTRSLGDFIYKLPPEQWNSQRDERIERKDNDDHNAMIDNDHSSSSSSSVSEWMNSTVPQVDITAPMLEDNLTNSSEDEMNEMSTLFHSYALVDGTIMTESNNNDNNNNNNNNSDNSDKSDSFGCKRLKYCSISATPHYDNVLPSVTPILNSDAEPPCLTNNIVSNIADVYEAELKGDEFLVLATDGVWDHMSTEEVVAFVRTRLIQSGVLSGNRPFQQEKEKKEEKVEKEKAEKEEKEEESMNENISLLPSSIEVSHPLPIFTDSSDSLKVPCDIKYTPPPQSLSLSLSTSGGRRFSSLALPHANNSVIDDRVEYNNSTSEVRFATPPPQCMGSRREDRINSFRFAIGDNNNNNNNTNNIHNHNHHNSSDTLRTSPCAPTNSDVSTQYSSNKLRHILQDVTNSLADHVVHDLHSGDNVTILLLVFHSTDESS